MKQLLFALAFSLPSAIASVPLTAGPVVAIPEAQFNQAVIESWGHFARLEYSQAVDKLDGLENLDKRQENVKTLLLLAILRNSGNLAATGRPEDAIALLTRAIELKDDHPHVRRRRGEAYCKIGLKDKCEADFNHAWTLETKRSPIAAAQHLSHWGSARQQAGDIEGAKEAFKSAAFYYDAAGEKKIAQTYKALSN